MLPVNHTFNAGVIWGNYGLPTGGYSLLWGIWSGEASVREHLCEAGTDNIDILHRTPSYKRPWDEPSKNQVCVLYFPITYPPSLWHHYLAVVISGVLRTIGLLWFACGLFMRVRVTTAGKPHTLRPCKHGATTEQDTQEFQTTKAHVGKASGRAPNCPGSSIAPRTSCSPQTWAYQAAQPLDL